MSEPLFIVSKEDWSLHRKGYEDQKRHQEKVREAIKENLPDLVSEESIILSDGKEILKVPIKSLDEYRFKYNSNKQKLVGQGMGNSKVGEVIGQLVPKHGANNGKGAGKSPGEDIYEAEITIDDIQEMFFQDLVLPDLQNKPNQEIIVEDIRFNDVRKKGLMGNIDKRRTILENLKRNSLMGKPRIGAISPEDLRFKTWEETVLPRSQAVVIAMMDTSGSMGMFEKYIARTFFFWMVRFLRTKYEHVEIVFIAHHTEAKEVTEEEFFTRGESGGTICSSAYKMAFEIINQRYPVDRYNIYPFHFSDGDNLTSDNEKSVKYVKELIKLSNMFGYGEVNQYNRSSTLLAVYKQIKEEKLRCAVIRDKSQVYTALKTFFSSKEDNNLNTESLN